MGLISISSSDKGHFIGSRLAIIGYHVIVLCSSLQLTVNCKLGIKRINAFTGNIRAFNYDLKLTFI